MKLKTTRFGEIEIPPENILTFPEGIPAFEDQKQFIILNHDENEDSPFKWMQSVDNGELAFVIGDPFEIKKDYDFEINDDILKQIELESEKDLLIYSFVVVPEDVRKISINLKAPVLINHKKKKGIQAIIDSEKYSVKHYILDELQKQEVAADVGSSEEERTGVDHK
jgi:flagellar assembly factor FliW